jgi:PQQ-dependent dehydrogenase (methanol/ethanol family)
MPKKITGSFVLISRLAVAALVALVLTGGVGLAQENAKPALPPFAQSAHDGQWTTPGRDPAQTRYSELDQINRDNVKSLKVAFTFSMGVNKGQESAPIVVGSTLYIVSPFPNILYALDLSQEGAPLKWQYNPDANSSAQGVACCDVVNRGPTYADGKIFYTTIDAQTVAVDADTGKEIWKTKIGEINKGETMTMAPTVAKARVFVGISGGEFGVRGFIEALDANTGKSVWKAYSTGPDQDVKIGARFKPFYESEKGKDLGVSTWPPNAWEQGGGPVWGFVSYDPDQNAIIYGVGNPGPWNPNQRPGDNKWTNGVFARDADTGEALWYYQYTPHDMFDWDGVNEHILVDIQWEGKPRKVLVHPDRNGVLYVIDRTNGEVLRADIYHPVNVHKGVNLKTGRIEINSDYYPVQDKVLRNVCPTAAGSKDWSPSSFSPRTGLVYMPHNNMCMDWESVQANYIAGTPYIGAEVRMIAGPGGHKGELAAWDIVAGKEVWKIRERFPVWGGTLVTASDIVFYGNMEGWFKAVDAKTGEELWKFKTASGIIGQPTTFKGPDGKQYVAILSGVGGWAGSVVSNDLDVRDGTAAAGFVNAMRDLKDVTTKGGTLYVFSLP